MTLEEKKKIINFKEFVELIIRYESITIEEIEKAFEEYNTHVFIKEYLTGFGNINTCTLCRKIGYKDFVVDCSTCSWVKFTNSKCSRSKNEQTYSNINFNEKPNSLLESYRERAKYMREVSDLVYVDLQELLKNW